MCEKMQCLFILAMITEARSQGGGTFTALHRAYTSADALFKGLNGKTKTHTLEEWDAILLAGVGVVAEQGML